MWINPTTFYRMNIILNKSEFTPFAYGQALYIFLYCEIFDIEIIVSNRYIQTTKRSEPAFFEK